MTFQEILTQVLERLQREGRVSYRALKRKFAVVATTRQKVRSSADAGGDLWMVH